jgi:Mn2+/Fe2+ NRAMP family transporter
MPAPMDIPIWHSLWSVAKNVEDKSRTSTKDALLDFRVGYLTTAILAISFLLLGALVMYPSGRSFPSSAVGFSNELINLYTTALGDWSYWLIAIAAFTTMFSTTLACLDAFSRLMRESVYIIKDDPKFTEKKHYNIWLIITVIGSIIILMFFLKNMKDLVDLATTLSFIVAPIYAYLNFKINRSSDIPPQYKFKGFEKFIAIFGLVFFTSFTLYYIYIKFL